MTVEKSRPPRRVEAEKSGDEVASCRRGGAAELAYASTDRGAVPGFARTQDLADTQRAEAGQLIKRQAGQQGAGDRGALRLPPRGPIARACTRRSSRRRSPGCRRCG
jgi:hypothetical protein